jgi:hypothetical protein
MMNENFWTEMDFSKRIHDYETMLRCGFVPDAAKPFSWTGFMAN